MREASPKEMITAVDLAGEVVDVPGPVTVRAQVPARDLPTVRPGQDALVEAWAIDRTAAGQVASIGTMQAQLTRSAPVDIALVHPDGTWRPGLRVAIRLVKESFSAKVAVPDEAIQVVRDSRIVFIREGDWFEARLIQPGRSDAGWVEVVSGVSPGERYAATNSHLIKAEMGKPTPTPDN